MIPMRKLSFILLTAGLISIPSVTFGAPKHLLVGSWNIENLADREPAQHPKALAQHIELSGVHLLALQEIHDTDESEARKNEVLDQVLAELNQDESMDWTYELFAGRDPEETARLTGVMWDRKIVSKVGDAFPIPVEFSDSAEVWKRLPTAVKFSAGEGKSDLVIVSLHMKSNWKVEGEPAPVELRKLEAENLVAQLDKVREKFGDDDIVLLGDTNCITSDEPAIKAFLDQGYRDLNISATITYDNERYQSPFDRIFIPKTQTEFKYSFQYVLTPTTKRHHERRLSDHFLVKAAVQILEDDD